MVENGHDASIPRLAFRPPAGHVPGFEIVDLATLHRRRAAGLGNRVHRVDFHTITLIAKGHGRHEIDFVSYPCRPGTLLWVHPGQVQRFSHPGSTNGSHLLFTSAFPAPVHGAARLDSAWDAPACRQLSGGPEMADVRTLLAQLGAEYSRPPGEVSTEILQLLLTALLLQIDRFDGRTAAAPSGGEVYARFRAELERSFTTTRRADDYARRLGYTVKTLTRACVATTGQSAKQVIDSRVCLEAQRLLAHSDQPVAAIADRLGFTEPTNFGKFFVRHTGTAPGAFRDAYRRACVEPPPRGRSRVNHE